MNLSNMIKNDPLVKAITGKSGSTKKRKKTLTATQKKKVNAQISRAKKSAYKKGLSAGKRSKGRGY